jgi:hypothetical protein
MAGTAGFNRLRVVSLALQRRAAPGKFADGLTNLIDDGKPSTN